MSEAAAPITELLGRARDGDRDAFDQAVALVYAELRRIAKGQLRRGAGLATPTLDTGALVHEAWLKLGDATLELGSREHFFAVAARAMRQLLIDAARRRQRQRRGGGVAHLPLEACETAVDSQSARLLALDEALDRLGGLDPRLRTLVELRFFGGLTEPQAAAVMGVSERTVRRDWLKARALLEHLLREDGSPGI